VESHAQACAARTSTWDLKTVRNATTPAPMDVLTVHHVQITSATQTVPPVTDQDP
jgi:hypothetical protein